MVWPARLRLVEGQLVPVSERPMVRVVALLIIARPRHNDLLLNQSLIVLVAEPLQVAVFAVNVDWALVAPKQKGCAGDSRTFYDVFMREVCSWLNAVVVDRQLEAATVEDISLHVRI